MSQSTYSLAFDGSGGYVDYPGFAGNTTDLTFWVSGWFQTSAFGGYQAIVDNGQFGGHDGWTVGTDPSGYLFFAWNSPFGSGGGNRVSNAPVNDGNWHHFFAQYYDTTGTSFLAIDAVSQTTGGHADDSQFLAQTGIRIGNAKYASGSFNGKVDDCAAGSGDQSSNAAGIYSGSVDVSTLSPFWISRKEAGSGPTAADTSGNGWDGTLNGGVTWSSDVPTPLAGGGGTSYSVTMSGGTSCSGSAPSVWAATATPAGGASTSGSAAVAASYPVTSSGGVTTGGTTTAVQALTNTMAGRAITGGSAAVAAGYTNTPSGGASAGGSATIASSYATTMAGGAITSGTATAVAAHAESMSGGLSTSGTAAVAWSISITMAGTVTTGGSADVSQSGSTIVVMSGGAATGGSAGVLWSTTHSMAGGVVASGSATVTYVPATSVQLGGTWIAAGGALGWSVAPTGNEWQAGGGVRTWVAGG